MGLSQRFGRAGVVDAIANTGYSAIIGWRAGEEHWSVVLTTSPRRETVTWDTIAQTSFTVPPSTSRRRHAPRSRDRHSRSPARHGDGLSRSLPKGESKPGFGGSNRRNPGSVARWARHAVYIGRFMVIRNSTHPRTLACLQRPRTQWHRRYILLGHTSGR